MRADRGNSTVEFVAVVPLLFIIGLSVLQLSLLAHAKSVVGAAATEAARVAAVSLDPEPAARQAAQEIIGGALGEVPVTGFHLSSGEVAGLPVVSVEVSARPAMTLLPDFVTVSGTGRALREPGR